MDLTELRRTIVSCKESISSASQDLTKLTGRNYDKPMDNNKPYSNVPIVSRDTFANNQRPTIKRRNSYENDNPVDLKRSRGDKDIPSLNSVVQITKGRTRNDAIHDLKTKENPKEKERCKRLFGHLMGTLNSIKKEAEKSTNDPQQMTRMKIEKKVEEDHKIISETIQREQNELIQAKKDREFELRILNQRYRAAEAFERWRIEKEKMKGFIRTSKPPYIFYKPKIINEEAQLRMDETAREIDSMIEARKKKLEGEIERVVKKHQEMSGTNYKQSENIEEIDGVKEECFIGSTVSLVNSLNGKARGVSPAHSFASEDYDDMIEEIEITMHDEPVHVQDDAEKVNNEMDIAFKDEELQKVADHDINIEDHCVDATDQRNDTEDQNSVIEGENILMSDRNVINEDQKNDTEHIVIENFKATIEDHSTDTEVRKNIELDEVDQVMMDAEQIIADEENQHLLESDRIVDNIIDDIKEQSEISDIPEVSQD